MVSITQQKKKENQNSISEANIETYIRLDCISIFIYYPRIILIMQIEKYIHFMRFRKKKLNESDQFRIEK